MAQTDLSTFNMAGPVESGDNVSPSEEPRHRRLDVMSPRRNRRRRSRYTVCKVVTALGLVIVAVLLLGLRMGIIQVQGRGLGWGSRTRDWAHELQKGYYDDDDDTVRRYNVTFDEEKWSQWRAAQEKRVAALEGKVMETTGVIATYDGRLNATEAKVQEEESEIADLKTSAYSQQPDLELRDEVFDRMDQIENQERAAEMLWSSAATSFDDRLNATKQLVTDQNQAQTDALTSAMAIERSYVDAANRDAQARVDEKIVEVYDTLGEYKDTTQESFESERDLIYHWIAGTFALLGFVVTLAGVYGHTRKKHAPEIQRKILTLLWMPSVYSACCWFSLVYPSSAAGLSMVRDGYEAYTIWAFGSFLFSVLGDQKYGRKFFSNNNNNHHQKSPDVIVPTTPQHQQGLHHRGGSISGGTPTSSVQNLYPDDHRSLFDRAVARLETHEELVPRAFCPPCGPKASVRSFVQQCTFATIQFVVLKPAVAIVAYILTAADVEDNQRSGGVARLDAADPDAIDWVGRCRTAVFIIDNLSVTIAFTGLIKVYHAVHHHISNLWPKFCSVKGIVFITYWQGILIWAMTRYGGSLGGSSGSGPTVAETVQNFLICVEMFIASVVHIHTFSPDEWNPNYDPAHYGVSGNFAIPDFINDLCSLCRKHRARKKSSSKVKYVPVAQDDDDRVPGGNDDPKRGIIVEAKTADTYGGCTVVPTDDHHDLEEDRVVRRLHVDVEEESKDDIIHHHLLVGGGAPPSPDVEAPDVVPPVEPPPASSDDDRRRYDDDDVGPPRRGDVDDDHYHAAAVPAPAEPVAFVPDAFV